MAHRQRIAVLAASEHHASRYQATGALFVIALAQMRWTLMIAQNLLLQPSDPAGPLAGIPTLRVADFGFARFLPQASMAETLCGSPLYMAPEILRYEKYDAKADLWSAGAVLYEMAVGRAPFRAANHVELLRKIEKGEDRIRFPDDPAVPPVPHDIRALICNLLKRIPIERMSFDDFFREADIVASSGPAAGIWPPPPSSSPSLPPSPTVSITRAGQTSPIIPRSPVLAGPSDQPRRPSASVRAPSSDAAFLPTSRPPLQPLRQPSTFTPKYVVGGSQSPPPIVEASVKTRDYAAVPVPSAAPPARRLSGPRIERDTPPDLAPASRCALSGPDLVCRPLADATHSLEDNSPMAPMTPRSAPYRARMQPTASVVVDDDSVLGREYVVVEKRTVEINALADELNSKRPSSAASAASTGRRNSRGFLTRPPSSMSTALVPAAPSSSGTSTPYPPMNEMTATPPFAMPKTRPSPPMRPPILPYASTRSPLGAPSTLR